ncbi:unnamed protein product [Prunus brigantina]
MGSPELQCEGAIADGEAEVSEGWPTQNHVVRTRAIDHHEVSHSCRLSWALSDCQGEVNVAQGLHACAAESEERWCRFVQKRSAYSEFVEHSGEDDVCRAPPVDEDPVDVAVRDPYRNYHGVAMRLGGVAVVRGEDN